MRVKLGQNIRNVIVDRFLADRKLMGDRFGGCPVFR
jgi:hypothetical protein